MAQIKSLVSSPLALSRRGAAQHGGGMRWALAVAMVAALLLAGGCNMSRDRQVIRSTPNEPMNVAVIDTDLERPIWAMEVPVGHELRLDFSHGRDRYAMRQADAPPTQMDWQISRVGRFFVDRDLVTGPRSGGIDLPEAPVRVEVERRETAAVSEAEPNSPEG